MKNKLIVMFFTFIVLIAITPFIFSKLMNTKFDAMLDNLKKDGIEVKLIEDKSSYIQTDKLFLVTIPEKFLVNKDLALEGVKSIVLEVEAQFKNLPVTDVLFLGEVKRIALSSNLENLEHELNNFVNYIKFVVTTPNFKDYFYKFEDIEDKNFAMLGIKGTFSKKELNKNTLTIKDLYIKNNGLFEVKNLKHNIEWNDKKSFSTYSFNLNIKNHVSNIQVDNIYGSNKTVFDKDISILAKIGFNKLISPNVLEADKFKLDLNLEGIESSVLKEIASTQNIEPYIEKIFEKGFKVAINSNLNTIKVLNKNLGGYKFNIDVEFLPTKNIEEKLKNNNFDFIKATLFLETSPEIATFIMNALPESAFLFELAKKEKDKVILNLEVKNGKLYSEGQLIK